MKTPSQVLYPNYKEQNRTQYRNARRYKVTLVLMANQQFSIINSTSLAFCFATGTITVVLLGYDSYEYYW